MHAKREKLRLWIKALRSGDYAQTTGTLHRTEETLTRPVGFCCLGVLTDIAAKDGCEIEKGTFGNEGYANMKGRYFPQEVEDWLGGETPIDATALVAMNDDMKLSFAEIADRLEAAIPVDLGDLVLKALIGREVFLNAQYRGVLNSVDDTSLTLHSYGAIITLPLSSITSIEVN